MKPSTQEPSLIHSGSSGNSSFMIMIGQVLPHRTKHRLEKGRAAASHQCYINSNSDEPLPPTLDNLFQYRILQSSVSRTLPPTMDFLHSIKDKFENLEASFKNGVDEAEEKLGIEKHSHTHLGQACHDLHRHTADNRFHSFAPIRGGNDAKWFVDGCGKNK